MTTTLRAAITQLQVHALASGAQEAPVDPPEGNAGFPFSVCYPGSGTIKSETYNVRRDLASVVLDYHINRQNLPTDVEAVESFLEAFPDLLINDPTLGGAVDTIRFDEGISYQFGEMEYAGVPTVGLRFTIPVKLRRTT
ncbi:MAG: hypothetical protein LC130_25645 [Bryobacterales bacterium]|nr:hypothetical protein [Bryobacterales bacterium]